MARYFALAFVLLTTAASAQDIRGFENCTAEKQMERRTSCLQANIDLMQQMITKLMRDNNARADTAARDLAAAKAEIVALKTQVIRLDGDLATLKATKK